MYGGGTSNGSPSTVSLDAVTMRLMPSLRAAFSTLNVLSMLFSKVATSLRRPGAGIAPRCTIASTPLWCSSMPATASRTCPASVRSMTIPDAAAPSGAGTRSSAMTS